MLGLPLQTALERRRSLGLAEPEIRRTCDPRGGSEGTDRVICVRGNVWITAAFRDGEPREKEEAP